MIIRKIEIHTISLTLIEPFIVSYTTYDTMPAIIIKIHTSTGVIGYGESVPDEHVTEESVVSVHGALKHQLILKLSVKIHEIFNIYMNKWIKHSS